MILERFKKQPSEDKDYDIDCSPWLAPIDDTLDDVVVYVENIDDELDDSLEVYNSIITEDTIKLWVRGGLDDQTYKVTIQAYTVGGRVDESELLFIIGEI